MANQARVPKFGNWEESAGDSIPYTTYFESARKGKTAVATAGKLTIINPNDPQESNPPPPLPKQSIAQDAAPVRPSPPRTAVLEPAEAEGGGGGIRQSSTAGSSPLRKPPSHQHRHEERKALRSERSFDQSPLNPNYRLNGCTTPGRAGRGRQQGHEAGGRGNETPGRGPAVPKFGEWDENNPACADGYTHIFNRVREERKVGTPRVPSEQNISKNHPDVQSESKCCCCFGF